MTKTKIINELLSIIFPRYDSDVYINFLRKKGVKIGKNTKIFSSKTVHIDCTRPSLLTIGDNVKITQGTKILTHGYDWSVLRQKYGEIIGSAGKVTIGNNVFIGVNTTILKGVEIGNNVIIGANSLVNCNFPDNVVLAGNPAKIIMNLDEYYQKRKNEYIQEAKEYALSIKERFNRMPKEDDFTEFFPLFKQRKKENLNKKTIRQLTDDYSNMIFIEKFLETKPIFKDFEDFLKYCSLK